MKVLTFGKLAIDLNSWHAQFYLRAYVHERASWKGLTDAEIADLYAREKAKFGDIENSDWWDEEVVLIHARNAEETLKRFNAGQISLCPYFHSLWLAALCLKILLPSANMIVSAGNQIKRAGIAFADLMGVARAKAFKIATVPLKRLLAFAEKAFEMVIIPLYAFGRTLKALRAKHETLVHNVQIGASVVASILFLAVMAVTVIGTTWMAIVMWDDIRTEQQERKETEVYNEMLSKQRQKQRDRAEQKRLEFKAAEEKRLAERRLAEELAWKQDFEAKRLQREAAEKKLRDEHELYLKENPEAMAAELVRREQEAYQQNLWTIRDRFDDLRGEVLRREQLVNNVLAIGIIIAAIALFIGMYLARAHADSVLQWTATNIPKMSFYQRLTAWRKKMVIRISAIGVAVMETLRLFWQFACASYRGICPYIEFKKPDDLSDAQTPHQ